MASIVILEKITPKQLCGTIPTATRVPVICAVNPYHLQYLGLGK
jgi:hypothetical protein